MSAIKGRSDDMLIIRGVNLFHTQVEELIREIPELVPHYQLIVSREKVMDEVEVKVEVAPEYLQKLNLNAPDAVELNRHPEIENLSNFFRKKIKDNTGISMNVNLTTYDSIPRSVGGKLSRIVDLRKK